jgi:type 1 fimbriae regulatory protein FimB/type 1 fimbriae regulatory protein FimE
VANLDLARAAPTAANVTVKAPRDYLTEREIEKLMDAARENRWGHRDATAILLAYRHGLRASELVGLRWDDIDWQTSTLHVRRAKGGIGTRQPLAARELRALRRLQREASGVHIFVSERGAPLSVAGYQRMVARAGEAARFPFLIHSHMLRHSCGYKLANDGARHAGNSALSRSPLDCLDRALHNDVAAQVQGVLEGLTWLLNGSVPPLRDSPVRYFGLAGLR